MAKKKLVIFGSRGINNLLLLEKAFEQSQYKLKDIKLVLSGKCKNSPDELGERWAEKNNIKVAEYPAKWDDISVKGAIVKTNSYGKKYNAKAGFERNEEMAKEADIGLAMIYDEGSPGTEHMIDCMQKLDKPVYVFYCSKGK